MMMLGQRWTPDPHQKRNSATGRVMTTRLAGLKPNDWEMDKTATLAGPAGQNIPTDWNGTGMGPANFRESVDQMKNLNSMFYI